MGAEGGEGGGREATSLQEGGRQERWKQTRVAGLGEAGHTHRLRAEASAELSWGGRPHVKRTRVCGNGQPERDTWSRDTDGIPGSPARAPCSLELSLLG